MNITIAGGGNVGTQFAVHCAKKGHQVTVYSSKPECFDNHLFIVDKTGAVIDESVIKGATDDDEKAFSTADLIFVTVPAFEMRNMAGKICPHIQGGG